MKNAKIPSYYSDRIQFHSSDYGWRDEYQRIYFLVDGQTVGSVVSPQYQELSNFEAYVRFLRQRSVA